MDSFVGALVAAAVGWASIVIASVAPVAKDRLPALRVAGGLSLGVVALVVVGLPIPSWVGLVVIAVGILVAFRPRNLRVPGVEPWIDPADPLGGPKDP